MSDPNAPGSVPPDEPFMPPTPEAEMAPPAAPTPPFGAPEAPPTLPKIVPMSDDEPLPDDAPTSDEASLPETALVAEAAPPADTAPVSPEATTQMPVAGNAGAVPPGTSPGTGFDDPFDSEPPPPWYKKSAPIIAAVVVVAAVAGLIAWLLFGGADDDDSVATAESSLLVLEVTDETGAAVDAGFIIDVQGPATAPADYTWIQPESAVAGELAGDSTGSDGRVEFEWEPAGAASDPTTWAANVTLAQKVPAGWTPPGPLVDCVLDRPDTQESVVSMAVTVDVPDPAVEQVADYSFPNHQFLAGDTVTCRLSTIRPVETTTTTSTTIEETTTTTSTTVAETTTTAAPATSAPVVTVPPQPEATLWDVIVNSPDLSELRALVELAGLQDVLSDPNATLTLLAPSNQAITTAAGGIGAPDFTNPAIVEAVLLTHVDNTQALLVTQLLALDPPEFVVVNPGPHVIDAAANPPTIGGAEILVADIEAANGVLHVIDQVLIPQTLPE
jgi:uncharacterized surface protein with fasciclin (FAS1) repeats